MLHEPMTFWLLLGAVAILSLSVGSFLNVVIHRIPIMLEREWESIRTDTDPGHTFNLATPASRCPVCNHQIRWFENIPVFSYLFLGGKCSSCKTKISLRYPAIETATALIGCGLFYHFGPTWHTAALIGFSWILLCLIFIDIDHQLLPDNLTLPLLWLGLLVNTQGLFTSLENAVWGAVVGYLSLWSVYWAFKLLTGKEGMGYGDFKLLAALGAWAGAAQLPLIILLSSLVGAVFGIAMMLFKKHDHQQPLPFGPYLAVAGWIALLWGDIITGHYLQFAGF
ncbi:A24 family peptidase [Neptuniibacter sp. CAU 1671]|uniref:prepilin peptidase n=1 Tax=Neptuniibacter sp. CAU 1671 TaxID=3032593 RepID=UPI0023DB780F|nr:A24 family peptidase [Neptuniibacter sp. CAU 1671]MDF2181552.1 A24 family peptidase [Neptuniibacter sp. CAU 1671]